MKTKQYRNTSLSHRTSSVLLPLRAHDEQHRKCADDVTERREHVHELERVFGRPCALDAVRESLQQTATRGVDCVVVAEVVQLVAAVQEVVHSALALDHVEALDCANGRIAAIDEILFTYEAAIEVTK